MQDTQPLATQASGNKAGFISSLGQSLERKLIMALVLLGIVPLIVMAGLSYFRAQQVLRDSVNSELESVASLTNDRVRRWMDSREADAKTYSASQFATGDGNNELQLGIEVIVQSEGTPEARTASAAARAAMPRIIEATGTTYSAIYLTDTNGRILVAVKNELVGDGDMQSASLEGHTFRSTNENPTGNFLEQARANNGFYRSPVISYIYNTPSGDTATVTTMFITHMVQDAASGEEVGAIVLEVNPAELQSLVETFANGDGETFLQSGDFLVQRNKIDFIPDVEVVRESSSANGVDELEGFAGKTVLGSWRTNEEMDYVVYAQIPRGKALADVNGLLIVLGLMALFIGAGIVVASLAFVRTVSRPIDRLISATQEIARGSLDTKVALNRSDEIGLLADAFNDMTDKLRVRVYEEKTDREYLEEILTSYMKFVERVSRGDLTARLSLNGQTGQNLIVANVDVNRDDNLLRLGYNLNRMVEALHSMASQTRDVARSLSEAAVDILEASNKQIGSTTQQDASVSQTTSTVAELRATVAETAERAEMVAVAAQQSVEISRQGQRAVAETIEGMNVIRSRVESIAENILMLSERTTQIGDIIATVNAIADQSKMLALNASIEAARAGEEGRGFAVVAMEVRNLAEQSREATAQVRDILSEIQQATNTAVMVTEEGTKGVDLGVQLVDRAGRAIRELAGKLEEAAQAAMQIAASTRQQSQGMDQLTAAMGSIKSATSTTAVGMQQSARSAKELNEMARQMESAISAYKL